MRDCRAWRPYGLSVRLPHRSCLPVGLFQVPSLALLHLRLTHVFFADRTAALRAHHLRGAVERLARLQCAVHAALRAAALHALVGQASGEERRASREERAVLVRRSLVLARSSVRSPPVLPAWLLRLWARGAALLGNAHWVFAQELWTPHTCTLHVPALGAGAADAVLESAGWQEWVPCVAGAVPLVLKHALPAASLSRAVSMSHPTSRDQQPHGEAPNSDDIHSHPSRHGQGAGACTVYLPACLLFPLCPL